MLIDQLFFSLVCLLALWLPQWQLLSEN